MTLVRELNPATDGTVISSHTEESWLRLDARVGILTNIIVTYKY